MRNNTFIPVYIHIHIQTGSIGCCNVLSAATKLRRLALCAFISEQFTVKAHPALFEGEGEGQKKIEEHFPEALA